GLGLKWVRGLPGPVMPMGWRRLLSDNPPVHLSGHEAARVYRRFAPAGYEVRMDRTHPVLVERATGELYHLPVIRDRCPSAWIERGVQAFARRRAERRHEERDAALDRLLAERGDEIYVSIADSLAAGNCEPMTLDFARRVSYVARVLPDLACAPASVILAKRDDAFTRRACRVAAMRYARMGSG
ncbi:MAG: hypothetical protein NZM12_11955, partial [Steroidobacteraceae bacterium]|nr:hypothetical protein [Steroidobacteraceae bacterium]MDW8257812.1 hypothetical protein [Gammaproteobacteria bacterium]